MSSLNFFCAFFFYLLIIQKSLGQIQSYRCTEGTKAIFCLLSDIQQTSSNKHFRVIPHRDVSEISKVYFEDSKIEILTEDICTALPYVTHFDADNLGVSFVEENTFKKCTKLGFLKLIKNPLAILPPGLFDSNANLSKVWLYHNKLTKIDGDLFKHNPKLLAIYLDHNKLQEFSFSCDMPILSKLQSIDLDGNELVDVGIEMLLEKCPNLNKIDLDENQFPCGRQRKIVEALMATSVLHFIGDCV